MVTVPRRTEGGDAPAWQSETREQTGSIRPRHNADRPDAAPADCGRMVTTGGSPVLSAGEPEWYARGSLPAVQPVRAATDT